MGTVATQWGLKRKLLRVISGGITNVGCIASGLCVRSVVR